MRLGETQGLRRKDVRLEWANGSIVRGEVVVPKSKTAAGTGRLIVHTGRARRLLVWTLVTERGA